MKFVYLSVIGNDFYQMKFVLPNVKYKLFLTAEVCNVIRQMSLEIIFDRCTLYYQMSVEMIFDNDVCTVKRL